MTGMCGMRSLATRVCGSLNPATLRITRPPFTTLTVDLCLFVGKAEAEAVVASAVAAVEEAAEDVLAVLDSIVLPAPRFLLMGVEEEEAEDEKRSANLTTAA